MKQLSLSREASLAVLRRVDVLRGLSPEELELLLGRCHPMALDEGEELIRQGEPGSDFFVLAAGILRVIVTDGAGARHHIRDLSAGAMVGEMQAILGGTRTATLYAATSCELLRIQPDAIDLMAERAPHLEEVLVQAVRRRLQQNLLISSLERALGTMDQDTLQAIQARATWTQVGGGQLLFRQGDPADSWYTVAHGRLSIELDEKGGGTRAVRELGPGESVGELSLLAGIPRTATVRAVRDSTLIRLSAEDFDDIVASHVAPLRGIARTLARRSLGVREERRPSLGCTSVALVPASPGVDLSAFARRLVSAFQAIGPALHVSRGSLDRAGGVAALYSYPDRHPGGLRFSLWLEEQAEKHRFLVLEADDVPNPWSARLLREADHVLIVGDPAADPAPTEAERGLMACCPELGQRTLLLLHPPETRTPRGTARWLDARDLHRARHVRLDRDGDVARLARELSGIAIGLALGAGGARGAAHIGVLRALEEAKIPVDHIAGASMGSIVGGLYAAGLGIDEIHQQMRDFARAKAFSDYTLPVVAVLGGGRVRERVEQILGDVQIEDLWIPYFCNSCDISAFKDVIHDRGSLGRALLASSALPGVLPPVVVDGHLLVDGGTTNMLPADLLAERGPGVIIAVDVSTDRPYYYPGERFPSAWKLAWDRLIGDQTAREIPSLPALFMRAVCLSVAARTEAVAASADLFIRPPVEHFGTIDFDAVDEIIRIGHRYAAERISQWRAPGLRTLEDRRGFA